MHGSVTGRLEVGVTSRGSLQIGWVEQVRLMGTFERSPETSTFQAF